MKTILVPIDGSDVSEKALEVALDLAEHHNAQVKLLHVLLRDKEPEELLRLPDLAGTGAEVAAELGRLVRESMAPTSGKGQSAKRPTTGWTSTKGSEPDSRSPSWFVAQVP